MGNLLQKKTCENSVFVNMHLSDSFPLHSQWLHHGNELQGILQTSEKNPLNLIPSLCSVSSQLHLNHAVSRIKICRVGST